MDRETLRQIDPEWALVKAEMPDADRWWPATERMLSSNGELGSRFVQMFEVDRGAAYSWALGRLGHEARKVFGDLRHGTVSPGRQDASIPSRWVGEAQRRSDEPVGARIAKLKQRAKATGNREDIDAFAKARIRQGVHHPDLDRLEGRGSGSLPMAATVDLEFER